MIETSANQQPDKFPLPDWLLDRIMPKRRPAATGTAQRRLRSERRGGESAAVAGRNLPRRTIAAAIAARCLWPRRPLRSRLPRRSVAAVVAALTVVGTAAVTASAVSQRFSDVPPEHEAFDAAEWAASVGLTAGYEDGTFRPDVPLSKRHAGVFMDRFYEQVLGAEESADFTRADMMMLLKAIHDGSAPPGGPVSQDPPAEESETRTDGRSIPDPAGRSADGRCAPAIVLGIYDWEDCAWGVAPDPEMSRSEMRSLTEKVWSETDAPGKPSEPPELTEGHCGEQALGCYLASSHTIRLSQGFTLRTLLHELSHALISGSEPMGACDDDWTHRQPECSHGDLYRCAADALFVRYGGIESAGVCGRAPSLDPGDWYVLQPTETEWGIIHATATITDESLDHLLVVRCDTDFESGEDRYVSVFMVLPRNVAGDAVRIRYRFSDEQHLSDSWWDVGYESSEVVWWPDDNARLIDRFRGAHTLYMRVEYGEQDVERLTFNLGDSPPLDIIDSVCQ